MKEDFIHKIFIEPVEQRITPEGTQTVVNIHADSDEEVQRGAELLGIITGSEIIKCDSPKRASGSSFFGFDSTRWKGSSWEPKGPKQNWAPPSLNNPELN